MPVSAQPNRVVIEYEFRGYTPPDELESYFVDCQVTYATPNISASGSLGDVRITLEDHGFDRHGAVRIKQRNGGRYCPTWREVWTHPGGMAR